jgi:hypothetical protein
MKAGTLTEDIRHFILEVLSSNKGVQELLATINHSVNFTTAATEILILIERIPEVVDGLVAGLGTGVNENADLGLENAADTVEEPAVRVDLLLVLGLEDNNDLDRDKIAVATLLRKDELWLGVNGQLGSVLEGNRKVSIVPVIACSSVPRRCAQQYPFHQPSSS